MFPASLTGCRILEELSFGDDGAEVEPRPLDVFIAVNGTGKSKTRR